MAKVWNMNLSDPEQESVFKELGKSVPRDDLWDENIPTEKAFKDAKMPRYLLQKNLGTVRSEGSRVEESFSLSAANQSKQSQHLMLEGVAPVKLEVLECKEIRDLKSQIVVAKTGELKLGGNLTVMRKLKSQLHALESSDGACCLKLAMFCLIHHFDRQVQGIGHAEAD